MVIDSLCFSVYRSDAVSGVLVLVEYTPLRESEEYGLGLVKNVATWEWRGCDVEGREDIVS